MNLCICEFKETQAFAESCKSINSLQIRAINKQNLWIGELVYLWIYKFNDTQVFADYRESIGFLQIHDTNTQIQEDTYLHKY